MGFLAGGASRRKLQHPPRSLDVSWGPGPVSCVTDTSTMQQRLTLLYACIWYTCIRRSSEMDVSVYDLIGFRLCRLMCSRYFRVARLFMLMFQFRTPTGSPSGSGSCMPGVAPKKQRTHLSSAQWHLKTGHFLIGCYG